MRKEFLKEEVRCNYKVSTQMKKVWAHEIDLVQELLRVCGKYNLKCWLDAGSLLGAVRHNGFIPWDDDIDLCMFRDDYDKLVSIAANEFEKPYLFQTAYTDKNYIRGHAQVRNTKTTAILPIDINQKFNQGIFIDVFVLDGVSDNLRFLSKQKKYLQFLKNMMFNIFYHKISMKDIKRPLYLFFSLLIKLIWGFQNRHLQLFKKYENLLRSVSINSVKKVALLGLFFEIDKRVRDKHLYDENIIVDFEYVKLPIPAGYHEILSKQYGKDYMTPLQLPTEHGSMIIDTERPSEEVLAKLRAGVVFPTNE
jgi:phosphorylcholine metabolism protein LicD